MFIHRLVQLLNQLIILLCFNKNEMRAGTNLFYGIMKSEAYALCCIQIWNNCLTDIKWK